MISFTEKELENLAVEFAEWVLQHKNPSFGIISGYKSPNHWADTCMGGRIDYTTQELFEIFKKEKSVDSIEQINENTNCKLHSIGILEQK